VWYTGHVQGVGFRYTTLAMARQYEVTGWVQNQADGRVRLVVEGEVDEIKAFLTAIYERMAQFIRETQEDVQPASGQFSQFEIR
jgi:acylphosphatase